MKIRCSCGVKYEFEVAPEMWQNPVKFVCTNCGLDSSEYVNQMVREEITENFPEAIEKAKAAAEPPPPAPRLKISHEPKPAETPAEAPRPKSSKYCAKHHGALAADKCIICGKPICLKCMEEFGYFCSPYCHNKADLQGIKAPVYAGQKFEIQKNYWRKTGWVTGGLVGLVILFLGVWTWYAWFGAVPHKFFAVRFEDNDRAYAGKSQLVDKDQIVFLHGGTLARYDLKTKKPIWVQELITKEDLAAAVKGESEAENRANDGASYTHRQSAEAIEREVKIGLQSSLLLRVSGENIWVGKGNRLTQYDWATGRAVREITMPEFTGELIEKDNELLMVGEQSVTHVSLVSGESRVEMFGQPGSTALTSAGAGTTQGGGLFSKDGQPLDPNKVAAEAQNLTLPARLALPALISSAQHEQALEAALRDDQDPRHPRVRARPANAPVEDFELVAGENSFVQFSRRLLEEKIVTHSAMKPAAAAGKSILDSGNLNVANEGDAVNQQLNEMQRKNAGDTVEEDVSRYLVTVRLPDSPDSPVWTNEVVGPPQLFVLKTVNVVVAGKTVIVLDKTNKKMWSASLTYPIPFGGRGFFARAESRFGAGPCVEHGDTLYIFDQALLSAFTLTGGDARWRVPSVGVVGLFFDDAGNVFVNTTSGNPDDIKYSRQIDITKHTDDVLLKLDSKSGKTLWSIKPGGFISYLKGKFIYTVQSYDPNPTDADAMNDMTAALQKPAFLRIARVDPKNGRLLWEYYDRDRCPIDVRFDENSIELVFKRELQVLRYLTF
jgi:hypothetical protein